MIGDDVLKAIAGIRGGSGQGFVQDASQRINVGRRRGRLAREPFGGHIREGADRATGGREPGVTVRLGDAEIDQIGEVGRGNDDVLGFDIAMDQPLGVRGLERRGDLAVDRDRAMDPAGPSATACADPHREPTAYR